MKPISAAQLIEELSEDLQDLVVREAYIRRKRDASQVELEEKRKKESGLQQTRPAFFIFRGKDAQEEFKSSGVRLREEIAALERTVADCEIILTKSGRIIESGLESYFEGKSDSFRNAGAAQKLIPEWEAAVGLYRGCLKRFIMALGIARNQMSSGYDRKSGSFAAGAQEAFGSALSAAKSLETEVAIPNRLAKQFREMLGVDPAPAARIPPKVVLLPYLSDHGGTKRVAAFKAASFEAARSGVSDLLAECEKTHDEVPAILEEAVKVRAAHESSHRAHVARPLAEIRAMADGSVDSARAEEVWISMEARFVSLTG